MITPIATSTPNITLRVKGVRHVTIRELRNEEIGHEQALGPNQERQVLNTYDQRRVLRPPLRHYDTGRPRVQTVHMEHEEIDTYADDLEFSVRSVEGHEAISELFSFDLMMVTDMAELELSALLYKPATLTMTRKWGASNIEGHIIRHGILADIRLIGRERTGTTTTKRIYKARLVPRLWQCSLQQHSQVFVDQTIKKVVETILDAASIDSLGVHPAESGVVGTDARKREMVIQYQESDLNFISRWLEHEGIHYTFTHGDADGVDRMVLSESANFTAIEQPATPMLFREDLTVVPGHIDDDKVTELIGCQQRIPRRVILKGYDWRKPASGFLSSVAQVDQTPAPSSGPAKPVRGLGDHAEYNARFIVQTEGDRLAKVRAEEYFCREEVFTGRSRSPFFCAGGKFTLSGHFDLSMNREYLLVSVTHHGVQDAGASDQDGESWTYHNEFVAVPSDRVFRPSRRTPWRR